MQAEHLTIKSFVSQTAREILLLKSNNHPLAFICLLKQSIFYWVTLQIALRCLCQIRGYRTKIVRFWNIFPIFSVLSRKMKEMLIFRLKAENTIGFPWVHALGNTIIILSFQGLCNIRLNLSSFNNNKKSGWTWALY